MNRSDCTVDQIISFIEKEFANIQCQCTWDFSGKQLYLENTKVTKLCLALDPTKTTVQQAIDRGCEILITHHPLFFNPLKGLTVGGYRDDIIITAIKNNLNILSYHTNLDVAPNGLNGYLVSLLGAEVTGLLEIEGELAYSMISVYVPLSHEKAVIDALSAAGAGQVGDYSRCAFSAKGIGTFIPNGKANPYIGQANREEFVEEVRIDMLLPNRLITAALEALKQSHPYEEPAFYIMPTQSPVKYSAGRAAHYEKPLPFKDFINIIKQKLNIKYISTNMPEYGGIVGKFAVATGSGVSQWKECKRQGIEILLTGDMKHHDALDAREAGVCIIDAGHFATEKVFMNHFADIIHAKFGIETVLADENPTIIIM